HIMNDIHRMYIMVSFTYLAARTVAKLLCASRVFEESQIPRNILYSVPSTSYGME
ncbi:hypothetical protein L9F63_002173, partial [Diploptera punctata]